MIPRSMLSAASTSSFGIFFLVHFGIACVVFLVYFVRVKSARQSMTKNPFGPIIIVVSSFFSFAEYRLDQVDFQDAIYYAVIIIYFKTFSKE